MYNNFQESRDSGERREHIRIVELIGRQPFEELLTNFLIRNDAVRTYDTGHIESLGRSPERDAARSRLVRNRRERNMLVPPKRHIAVNLVRNHQNAVSMTE